MRTIFVSLLLAAAGAANLLSAPARSGSGGAGVSACCSGAPAGVAADVRPSLDCVKELAGTWVAVDEKGTPTEQIVARYRVTAGGKAVIETLFPDSEHEMISMYYQDGAALMLTHYCIFGNHPRMRASLDESTGEVVFTCAGAGENFRSCAETEHMHEGRVKRIDADHMRSRWTAWADGKPSEEPHVFEIARVR